ncbi:MAG: hypothetical protein COA78_11450 [Blastopirellula sp.]|nr:MAG: hypothetical protein COA78_11450 [Blastopirellula sp.]
MYRVNPSWLLDGIPKDTVPLETDEFIVEHEGDLIRVEVPMPLPYWPGCHDPSLLTPIMILCYAIYKWIYKPLVPPRAQFLIDSEYLTMNLCDPKTGEKVSDQWPSLKVVELRKNQYHEGLLIRIEGVSMETYLYEMSDDTINSLSEVLRESIRKVVTDSNL